VEGVFVCRIFNVCVPDVVTDQWHAFRHNRLTVGPDIMPSSNALANGFSS